MAANSTAAASAEAGGFEQDVRQFSDHCAYIRTVFVLTVRIWRDSNDDERQMMDGLSPLFFLDIGQVLAEYVILAACRISDPAKSGAKNENFTIEFFVESFSGNQATHKQLDDLWQIMKVHRERIKPARDKIIAHADREAIRSGKPLGMSSWKQWDEFWDALASFIRVIHEKTFGSPFEIDAAGAPGDAEMLIKAIRQSKHFETLVNTGDKPIRDACLKVAGLA